MMKVWRFQLLEQRLYSLIVNNIPNFDNTFAVIDNDDLTTPFWARMKLTRFIVMLILSGKSPRFGQMLSNYEILSAFLSLIILQKFNLNFFFKHLRSGDVTAGIARSATCGWNTPIWEVKSSWFKSNHGDNLVKVKNDINICLFNDVTENLKANKNEVFGRKHYWAILWKFHFC